MLDKASVPLNPDLSDSQRLRARLTESARALDLTHKVARLAVEMKQPDEFIGETMRLVCEQRNAVLAVAWLYNMREERLEYRLHIDMQRIETAELIENLMSRRLREGEGLPGLAFRTGEPQVQESLDASDDISDKLAQKAGMKCSFAVPIRQDDRTIGVMEFYARKPLGLSETTYELLCELGAYVGVVTEHKSSDAKIQEMQAQQEGLQQQLKATADQAIQSAKLKSEFVANVSHEVRTPLAGIMGMAEMLTSKEDIDEETKELANYILSSSHSLLAIVNDLLDFSKLEAGKLSLYKTYFSINDVVESIARSARASADKKGLMVRSNIDEKLPEKVLGDGARLTQILMNFAHNAVKFTEKGEVAITAELDSQVGNQIHVKFAVSDTGIGITPEGQSRLFEPFVQADGSTTRRFGGTGLGLSIARKLTQLMDGEIVLDSEEGVGSTFTLSVPFELNAEEMIG